MRARTWAGTKTPEAGLKARQLEIEIELMFISKLEIGTYFIVVVVVKEEVVVVMEEEMVVIVVVVAAVVELEEEEVVVVEEEDVVGVVPALKRISKCAARLCFPALSQENR